MVVTAFVLADLVDGAMARARGYGTDFGVVLDASCDRIADGALFGALAFYAFSSDQRRAGRRRADLPGHRPGDLLRQGPGRLGAT